jgi:hypothetical protein
VFFHHCRHLRQCRRQRRFIFSDSHGSKFIAQPGWSGKPPPSNPSLYALSELTSLAVIESELRSLREKATMISNRTVSALFVVLATLCVSPRTASAGQSSQCSPLDMRAALKMDDPAFLDAMELAQTLRAHGFTVKCVLLSKMVNQFEGQKGAALYRTSAGDFEALFLAQPKVFDSLNVVERRDGESYFYSFKGPPQPRPAMKIQSVDRNYFIRYRSMLFVLRDRRLAATLTELTRSH